MTHPQPKFYKRITLKESATFTGGVVLGAYVVAITTLDPDWSVWEAAGSATVAAVGLFLWDIWDDLKAAAK